MSVMGIGRSNIKGNVVGTIRTSRSSKSSNNSRKKRNPYNTILSRFLLKLCFQKLPPMQEKF